MESNYFITENPDGVSIRLKSNNQEFCRIVRVPRNEFLSDDDFACTGIVFKYRETFGDCYGEARRIIDELDKVDACRLLPKVKLPRSVDGLAHPKSLEE